jgi:hypothetical protein
VDRRIWVIASDEGHLAHEGGLLEYNGTAFEALGKPGDHWFLTSYTPLDTREAIAGTAHGFAVHGGGRLASIDGDLGNASYVDVVARQRRGLFLGTRGARFGDAWLFGTASGVVSYERGPDRTRDRWRLLEGVNGLLPDRWLLERGGRHVRAIETDPRGNIYVATDRGLLVVDATTLYDVEGNDLAFAEASRKSIAAARTAIGDVGVLEAVRAPERELAAELARRGSPIRATTEVDAGHRRWLDEQLEQRRAQVRQAHHDLDQANRALATLARDEVDVSYAQGRMQANQCIVRYRATASALLIDVIHKGRVSSRWVRVPGAELERRAQRVVERLAAAPATDVRAAARARLAETGQPPLEDELAWLYDKLLAPIEVETRDRYVIAVLHGGLAELPLGALVRTRAPRLEYAVERMSILYAASEELSFGLTYAGAARPLRADAAPRDLVKLDLRGTSVAVVEGGLPPGRASAPTVHALGIAGAGAVLFAPPKLAGTDLFTVLKAQREAIARGDPLASWATARLVMAR